MSRWALTEEVREEYSPIIKKFIAKLEALNPTEETEPLEIELSDTKLNPYTLIELLKGFGYERIEQDDNGWQLDFWITLVKEGFKTLSVEGTGITFELKLCEKL